MNSISLLQETFDKLSCASILKANLEKSSIYMAGSNKSIRLDIIHKLGYLEERLPFKYLGVPLSTKKLSVSQCLPLVEKFTAKLRCWSAKLLSYAGKLQFIKLTLFRMQSYWAQIFVFPKKVVKILESVCKTYLWIGQGEISKKSLVAWDRICQLGSVGGLNVIDLKLWNKPAILKHLWAISMKKDIMWIRWLCSPSFLNLHGRALLSINPRFKILIWFVVQLRLTTVERLQKIGIQVPILCIFCDQEVDSFEHLFFRCVYSNQIWTRILKWMGNYISIGPWKQEIEWVSRIAK
ncbi:hypothetical protein R3W88_033383 [Solanum pinnatisectum]|uniref:Reverse transcriptase zinc-binding domain-containing protein n=1 Tax=Solanum pinnatisectum TaxID=50273 RepID=A0AAV9K300_9SOLN|nr:hypothetical protein R3W88_033383 [Solanum pinnatisectum]